MFAVEGVDEFNEFAEDMDSIVDGLAKAKRDAIKATADDFITALTQRIRSMETAKGGTLYSRTSPYSPGGTNESTDSNLHIQNKGAWETEVVGDDMAVVYPNPEVHTRASWLNYGTAEHGPSGDDPMTFDVGGTQIIVSEEPINMTNRDSLDMSAVAFGYIGAEPGEVSGVEPQRFFEGAIRDTKRGNRFKENMGDQLDQLFEEQGIVLEGDW
jgi:hypothetical protein